MQRIETDMILMIISLAFVRPSAFAAAVPLDSRRVSDTVIEGSTPLTNTALCGLAMSLKSTSAASIGHNAERFQAGIQKGKPKWATNIRTHLRPPRAPRPLQLTLRPCDDRT
ncbi:hypothetical protein V8E53_007182 [Lactarius tabidus]